MEKYQKLILPINRLCERKISKNDEARLHTEVQVHFSLYLFAYCTVFTISNDCSILLQSVCYILVWQEIVNVWLIVCIKRLENFIWGYSYIIGKTTVNFNVLWFHHTYTFFVKFFWAMCVNEQLKLKYTGNTVLLFT